MPDSDSSSDKPVRPTRTRRPHRKSRHGCRACKARRIKCDEVRPSCGNCVGRDVHCDFLDSAVGHISLLSHKVPIARKVSTCTPPVQDQGKAVAPLTGQSLVIPLYPGQEASARVFELRLFHHFILDMGTFRALDTDVDARAFAFNPYHIVKRIPKLAMQSGYIMDALLAMSSMSMFFRNRGSQQLKVATFNYMARAIAKLKDALRGDDAKKNPELVYTASVIIASHTLNQHLVGGDDHWAKDGPAVWLTAFRGLNFTEKWRPEHVFGPEVSFSGPREASSFDEVEQQIQSYIPPGSFEFLLEDEYGNIDLDMSSPYYDLIIYLSLLYEAPSRPLMWWFLSCNREDYIQAATRGDPKARLILAVWLVLASIFNRHRPLAKTGEQDIQLIKQQLGWKDLHLLSRATRMIRDRYLEDRGWDDGDGGSVKMELETWQHLMTGPYNSMERSVSVDTVVRGGSSSSESELGVLNQQGAF